MVCIKNIYEVWLETRQVHHGGDGKLKDEEKIRPLALKASDDLEEDWREMISMVHEEYVADKTNEEVMVSRLLTSLGKIFSYTCELSLHRTK